MATKSELIEKYGLPGSTSSGGRNSQGYTKNELLVKYGMADIDYAPETYINQYLHDYNSFYDRWANRAKGAGWSEAMSGADRMREEYDRLSKRSGVISDFLSKNQDAIDPDYYEEVMANLDSAASGYNELLEGYKSLSDYYGQWGSQEEYDSWVRDYEAQQEAQRQNEQYSQNQQRLQDLLAERDRLQGLENGNSKPGYNHYTNGNSAPVTGSAYGAANQDVPLTEEQKEANRLSETLDWMDYVDKYVGKTYEDNFSGQYSANRMIGRLSQDSSLYWNAYLDDPTEENRRMAETADELIERSSIVNGRALDDDGEMPWITKDLANYAPQFWDQMKYGAGGAIAGAALTMGNPFGAKAGYVAGSAAYGYQTMRGAAFRELIKAGMDEDTARAAANDEAVISSLIEAGDAIKDIVLLGTGSVIDLATKGGATAVKNWLSKAAGKNVVTKLLTALGKYALNAGGEYLEESTQEAVSIANQERDTSGILDLAARAISVYAGAMMDKEDEHRDQIQEAGMGGLRLGLMTGGAQMVGNAAVGSAVGNIRAEMEVGELRPKLRELTAKTLELNQNDKNALRVQAKMDQGDRVSGMDIYKMLLANEEAAAKKDTQIVREAVASRLTELGEQGDIDAISDVIARQAAGDELGRKDFAAIRDSKYAQQIVRELNLLGNQEKQSSFDNKTEGAQWRDNVNASEAKPGLRHGSQR